MLKADATDPSTAVVESTEIVSSACPSLSRLCLSIICKVVTLTIKFCMLTLHSALRKRASLDAVNSFHTTYSQQEVAAVESCMPFSGT